MLSFSTPLVLKCSEQGVVSTSGMLGASFCAKLDCINFDWVRTYEQHKQEALVIVGQHVAVCAANLR